MPLQCPTEHTVRVGMSVSPGKCRCNTVASVAFTSCLQGMQSRTITKGLSRVTCSLSAAQLPRGQRPSAERGSSNAKALGDGEGTGDLPPGHLLSSTPRLADLHAPNPTSAFQLSTTARGCDRRALPWKCPALPAFPSQ